MIWGCILKNAGGDTDSWLLGDILQQNLREPHAPKSYGSRLPRAENTQNSVLGCQSTSFPFLEALWMM